MMEVTAMLDYLMLRPVVLRRCVVAGHISFGDLREVAAELIPVWNSVREFARYTGPRHFKSETDMVSTIISDFFVCIVFPLLLVLVGCLWDQLVHLHKFCWLF